MGDMRVYVVFHADIEDDRYVRAVCSTRERAEAIANSVQPCSMARPDVDEERAGILHEHYDRYTGIKGRQTTDAEHCWNAHWHFVTNPGDESLCCGVEEWEIDVQARRT